MLLYSEHQFSQINFEFLFENCKRILLKFNLEFYLNKLNGKYLKVNIKRIKPIIKSKFFVIYIAILKEVFWLAKIENERLIERIWINLKDTIFSVNIPD